MARSTRSSRIPREAIWLSIIHCWPSRGRRNRGRLTMCPSTTPCTGAGPAFCHREAFALGKPRCPAGVQRHDAGFVHSRSARPAAKWRGLREMERRLHRNADCAPMHRETRGSSRNDLAWARSANERQSL
jgi:hypothetical protein